MTANVVDFSGFSQAHAEKVAHGVRDVLAADSVLTSFTDGRIYRTWSPLVEPDRPLPFITVCADTNSWEFQVSGEAVVTCPIAITIYYFEDRPQLVAADKTILSALSHIGSLLRANQRLDMSPLGPTALTDRIVRLVPFFATTFVRDDESSGVIEVIRAEYEYHIDADTGVKT